MAKRIVAKKTPDLHNVFDARIFGQIVRARRTQLGIDLVTASMLCGVSLSALQGLESRGGGRLDTALKICAGLGIKISIESWEEDE